VPRGVAIWVVLRSAGGQAGEPVLLGGLDRQMLHNIANLHKWAVVKLAQRNSMLRCERDYEGGLIDDC
jgi:hypothetical protein